jgi:Domain of unknown function (DUF5615)
MSHRLRFLTDEDFDNDILRALLQRLPDLDVIRAQDVGLTRTADPAILEWAAAQGRILLTHDVTTMKPYAYDRVANGLPMPGVFVVSQIKPLGLSIEHLVLLAECSLEGEWEGRVRQAPRMSDA